MISCVYMLTGLIDQTDSQAFTSDIPSSSDTGSLFSKNKIHIESYYLICISTKVYHSKFATVHPYIKLWFLNVPCCHVRICMVSSEKVTHYASCFGLFCNF